MSSTQDVRSLKKIILNHPADLELWRTPNDQIFSCANARQFFDQHDSNSQKFKGGKFALKFQSPEKLAQTLILLDGVANELLLVPFDVNPSTLSEILSSSGIDQVLDDSHSPMDSAFTPSGSFSFSGETTWKLMTSGTTGSPKVFSFTLKTLTHTAKSDLQKGKVLRWGMMYDLARFAGLQVFLQSVFGGSCFIFTNLQHSIDNILSNFIQHGANAVSATPTMWRKLLMSPKITNLPLKLITLGGEITDQNILNALKSQFPEARLVHIYASTEAGVGFSVKDKVAGFPASYLSSSESGSELKADANGILWIRPKVKLDNRTALMDSEGFINTGDKLKIDHDRVYFLGRANGAINVGGNKVWPEEVERVLLSFPGVRLAQVFAKASPITGQILAANIVLESTHINAEEFRSSLRIYCQGKLENYKVPALFKIVDSLGVNATGKLMRS